VKYTIAIIFSLFLLSQQAFAQTVNHWENYIDAADTWKYHIPTSELPASWTSPDFDDASWLSGPGGFGYGDGDDNTLVPEGTISVFVRKSFTLTNASDLVSAVLYVDYDDAFVAYLNGTEIARANIGAVGVRPEYNDQAINALEPASTTGAVAPRFVVDNSKLATSLKDGLNTLALQFHNHQASSSDFSSTTFFIGGFSTTSNNFRSPPFWFTAPPSVTSYLPLVVIDTWGGYIQDEPKIDAWIKIIDNGAGKTNNISDPGTDFEGLIGIELRGQSSQMFPKKGYGFETRNALKEDSTVSLLGMPKESDWILSAPYSDKSLMRNPMSFYLGNTMGRWQPGTKWCELYVDDDYKGVYLLVEKIKRDKKRVNIDKLLPTELLADSLTGGYIVKVDKLDGLTSTEYFRTYPTASYFNARRYDFTYVYPKADEIMPAQKVYIKDFLTKLETALNGTNFKDPVLGFRAYMDELSFVEYEIIEELANDVDGYRYSTFFHKEKDSDGGKLIAGPLWDFDLCYGNVDYAPSRLATDQWLYVNYGTNEGSPMHWWRRLMEDPNYAALVKWRYSHLRNGPLHTDSIMAYLDDNIAYLGDAVDRNFDRWPILNEWVWPNAYVGFSHDNELDYLKTWLTSRLEWMDSKWLIPLGDNNKIVLRDEDFSVFPNPFNSRINLSLTPKSLDAIDIAIYNLQGQQVFSHQHQPNSVSKSEIPIENLFLRSGLYILQAKQNGQIIAFSKLVCTGDH